MSNAGCFPITNDGSRGTAVLNTITKVRLADGTEVGIVDWGYRDLYSVLDTLSGWSDQELRAFTYADGDEIAGSSNRTVKEIANLRHTNITSASVMDAMEEMLVFAIQTELYYMREDTEDAQIVADEAGMPLPLAQHVAQLHERCILELEVAQKAYFQASLGKFPAGFGVSGFGGGNATAVYGGNGAPSFESVDMSPVPVHIGGIENYAVLLHNPDGGAITYLDAAGEEDADGVIRLRFNLHGLHKRATG